MPYTPKHPTTAAELVQLLNRSYKNAETMTTWTEADLRASQVLIALGLRDDPEKLPKPDLSDLGLPKETTTDPFSGRPLIVKKVDGSWLVYPVGENLMDDGGDLEDSIDVGLRPVIRTKPDPPEQEHGPE